MSKLYVLNGNRSGRLGRLLAVLSVFSVILTSAQLPALLGYGIASAAAPSTALNLSSGSGTGGTGGTGGHSGILPPSSDPGTDPASTAVPIDPSATPGKGKATDTPYPKDPLPTVPNGST